MATPKTTTRRKKTKRNVPNGQAHIKSTFNNTIITLTDDKGNTLAWLTAGAAGFKGSRKSTPYAAQIAGERVASVVKDYGMERVEVFVKGIGSGRESAVRALSAAGLKVVSIKDLTSIPHNGCRARKPRRV